MTSEEDPPVERRLAAILAADVVGYSRLMGQDELGTLARLKAHRRELIDPAVARHRGRIVKTTGDGALVEFSSVVDAVRCAIAIQEAMAQRNSGLAPEQRIDFRIGVNVGDIIVDGDDIYGDGVNIAARLEGIAEPGGITLSSTVRDHVLDKLAIALEDRGEQTVKNIARPIRVFRVRLGEAPESATAATPKPASAVPSLPRLSLVVLPFANLSSDAEQEYFADGLTEDLTTELSRVPGAFVIARNTAFTFKGKSVDVKQLGRELGVRYALEGSTRKAGNRVRVNAQLIDAESGAHLWADRFDREIIDLFELQDAVTLELAGVLGIELVEAESRRGRRSTNLDAVDLAMRGRAAKNRGVAKENMREALALFEEALRLDPDHVPAMTGAVEILTLYILTRWTTSRHEDLARAETMALRAKAIDPRDPWARYAVAMVRRLQYAFGEVMSELEAAIRLNPNMAPAHMEMGFIKIMLGQCGDALPHFERAIRLSPRDPRLFIAYIGIGYAHLLLGNDEEAIAALRRSLALNAANSLAHQFLSAAYAWHGSLAEARLELAEFLRNTASIKSLADLRAEPSSTHPTFVAQRERLFEGLRRAGLPDH